MWKLREISRFLLFVWICNFVKCENDSLSDIINNPAGQEYFNKYGHCSVSTSGLRDSYFAEGQLVKTILKGYKTLERDRYDKREAKDYIELDEEIKKALDLITTARETENTTKTPTNHPINALHFMRRIVVHFNPILNKIFTSKMLLKRRFYQDLSSVLDRYIREECSCWPTPSDIQIAVSGLAKIINVYKIPKTNISNGIIFNHTSIKPMLLDEMIVLAQESNRNNYYSDVLEWVEFLLNKFESEIKNNKNQFRNLVRMKAAALFNTKNEKDAINLLEEIIQEKLFDTKLLERDLKFYKSKSENDTVNFEDQNMKHSNNSDSLCRDNYNSSIYYNLRCFYRRIKKGWDRAKVEVLNINPPIYKYYGVLKDEDIYEVFNLVKTSKIKQHVYLEKGVLTANEKYSKEEAIFWDEDYDIMKSLSRQISHQTGLETNNHKYNTRISSSGPFKVINYGIGGYEELEVDYLAKVDEEKKKDISVFGGDRLATWLYQLTDKIEGGRLVFPKIKMSILLEQGTGLLWFNLLKNGTVNPLSEHMECPVAFGSKWVVKKFIHENGNMFTRKCYRKTESFF